VGQIPGNASDVPEPLTYSRGFYFKCVPAGKQLFAVMMVDLKAAGMIWW